jgi:hypothetical protein
MIALSLWQPWASLVAVGAKRIETRHWPAPESLRGERIAIHAAKRRNDLWLLDVPPFNEYGLDRETLPLGCIVATAVLVKCSKMDERMVAEVRGRRPHEHAFGLWMPGRWAWILRDVEPVDPVPTVGRQGLFNVPAPEALAA